MAEAIMRKRVTDLGRSDIQVSSMGIHGLDSQRASQTAAEVCCEHGVDIGNHISRPLIPEELLRADLIFTMEPVHKEFLRVFFPKVFDRTHLLGSWPDRETRKGIIRDPIGGTLTVYRKAFDTIDKHIERILPFVVARFPLRPSGQK